MQLSDFSNGVTQVDRFSAGPVPLKLFVYVIGFVPAEAVVPPASLVATAVRL
jgi:hypothetical protein